VSVRSDYRHQIARTSKIGATGRESENLGSLMMIRITLS
jgi:hypothetical protein